MHAMCSTSDFIMFTRVFLYGNSWRDTAILRMKWKCYKKMKMFCHLAAFTALNGVSRCLIYAGKPSVKINESIALIESTLTIDFCNSLCNENLVTDGVSISVWRRRITVDNSFSFFPSGRRMLWIEIFPKKQFIMINKSNFKFN